MKVIELVKAGTTEVAAFQCGVCGMVFGPVTPREAADRCCRCSWPGCQEETRNIHCEAHAKLAREDWAAIRRRAASLEDAEHYATARKVSWRESTGPVFLEPDTQPEGAPRGTCGEGYFHDAKQLADAYRSNGLPIPDHCWATCHLPLSLDADNIIENSMDEHPESAIEKVDVHELQKLLDAWCDRNDPGSYMRDEDVAVLLDGIETALTAGGE